MKRRERRQTSRIAIRTSATVSRQVDRAAALSGLGKSEYIREVLAREARKTIQEHETVEFTKRDRKAFIEAMRNPPPWPEHMDEKLRRYRERIVNE